MMINYYMMNDDRGGFSIIEKRTGYTIKEGMTRSKAYALLSNLNKATGFNGWTPEFISRKINVT